MKSPAPKPYLLPRGFTLVELLVVLVIATVVLSVAIPRIRSINEERNLREAARVVGSTFAKASQRAVIDGIAGVRITRNANFTLGSQQFAATELALLRKVPNYVGDAEDAEIANATETMASDTFIQIDIPLPFEQDSLNIVQQGDLISFGQSSVKYRIVNLFVGEDEVGNPDAFKLRLDLERGQDNYLPDPNDASTFTIYRRPRVLRSSVSDLPSNYIIDLRYSGFLTLDGFDPDDISSNTNDVGSFDIATSTVRRQQLTRVFEPAPTDFSGTTIPPLLVENYNIDVIFDEFGAIDYLLYTEVDHDGDGDADEDEDSIAGETVFRRPLGSLYFFVTEIEESPGIANAIATGDELSLWVTVSNNGATNIGYNNSTESQQSGLTIADFSNFYFAEDLDGNVNNFLEEDDRDEFNGIIERSRDNSLTTAANQ